MTNRILINSSTFKVSKPGFNVSSATGDQLAFDANNGYSYAGIVFAGTEDITTFASNIVNPWNPWSATYNYSTTHRWQKDITFASKGINRTFSAPPGVLFMVKRKTSGYNWATPTYSYAQQLNWPGSTSDEWCGGAIWASCSIDGNGYGTLTIRMDKSDFATSMPTDWLISYIVFQNFSNLPSLTPV
jgi:hypothetical protein